MKRLLAALLTLTLILAAVALAFGGNTYEADALAAAHAAGWTAAQANAATYRQVATAAGVTVAANGDSPADFHYRHVRRHVARTLLAEERAAAVAVKRARLKAGIQQLQDFADVTITRLAAGDTATGPCWIVKVNN